MSILWQEAMLEAFRETTRRSGTTITSEESGTGRNVAHLG